MATEAVTPQQISFWPGNRRRVELEDWQPLLNAQDEKRVRLDILMPQGHRNVLIPGATLRNFKLVRVTRNEQGIVALKFSITFKADSGLVLWAHKYHGGTFWASFVVTQPTLDLGTQDDKQMKLGEQSPADSEKNIKEFFDKDKATKAAQKAVSKQPIEEQAAELASAKKPN